MAQRTETDLLLQRLESIRSEKAGLIRRLDELSANEERINYAVDVFRSVIADMGDMLAGEERQPIYLSASTTVSLTGTAMLSTGPTVMEAVSSPEPHRPRMRQSLETTILEMFTEKTGMTSGEVAEMVELFADAKRGSILSTLSRMTTKGLVRREGKLYFRGTKGEGSEVATSEPSNATTSGDGLDSEEEEL